MGSDTVNNTDSTNTKMKVKEDYEELDANKSKELNETN